MELRTASQIAGRLVSQMDAFCLRTQIAGSIRRAKPEVRDLEICVVPRWDDRPGSDLFGDPVPSNALYEWAVQHSGIRWIKTGTSEITDWQIKPDGYLWRGEQRIDTPDEPDVFRELGLEYIHPSKRIDASSLRMVAR